MSLNQSVLFWDIKELFSCHTHRLLSLFVWILVISEEAIGWKALSFSKENSCAINKVKISR
jgi:hypothetical protein